MKPVLVSLSKSIILQTLQEELKSYERKYEYHKRIVDEYLELITNTRQKLEELD